MTVAYLIRETQSAKILELPRKLTGPDEGSNLEAVLEDMLASGEKNVILDFSRVASVDTFVLGTLIREHIRYRDRAARLVLLKPAGKIKDVLVMTKLITVFDSIESIEDEGAAINPCI